MVVVQVLVLRPNDPNICLVFRAPFGLRGGVLPVYILIFRAPQLGQRTTECARVDLFRIRSFLPGAGGVPWHQVAQGCDEPRHREIQEAVQG